MNRDEYYRYVLYANDCYRNMRFKEAFNIYCKLYEGKKDDSVVLYNLGNCFCFGLGTEKNVYYGLRFYYKAVMALRESYAEAFAMIKRFSEQENEYANYLMGECYRNGFVVERNTEKAKAYYSAVYQNAGNYTYLALEGLIEVDFYNNPTKVYQFINFLITENPYLNDMASLEYKYALCKMAGFGTLKDSADGLRWALKAFCDGNKDIIYFFDLIIEDAIRDNCIFDGAVIILGDVCEELYKRKEYKIINNIGDTLDRMHIYAEKVYFYYMLNFYYGNSIEQQKEYAYEHIKTLLKNKSRLIVDFLKKEHKSKDPLINRALGKYYLEIGKDDLYKQALYHFKIASESGDGESMAYMGQMLSEGKGGRFDLGLAEQYYLNAGNSGFEIAFFIIGLKYYSGKMGYKRDIIKAKHYLKNALNGKIPANYRIKTLNMLFDISYVTGQKNDAKEYSLELVDRYQSCEEKVLVRLGTLLYYDFKDYERCFIYLNRAMKYGYPSAYKEMKKIEMIELSQKQK